MAWTDDKVELLKKGVAEGLSFGQIAQRMGGEFTRNAVLGKAHRLGLAGAATKARQGGAGRPKRVRKSRAKASPALRFSPMGNLAFQRLFQGEAPPQSTDELVIPLAERKTIATLERHDCRWPIGDPQAKDFHFCGKTKIPGLSYCEFHARRAFVFPEDQRAARRARAAKKEFVDG